MKYQNMRFDNLKMLQLAITGLKTDLGLSEKQIIEITKTLLKGENK